MNKRTNNFKIMLFKIYLNNYYKIRNYANTTSILIEHLPFPSRREKGSRTDTGLPNLLSAGLETSRDGIRNLVFLCMQVQ